VNPESQHEDCPICRLKVSLRKDGARRRRGYWHQTRQLALFVACPGSGTSAGSPPGSRPAEPECPEAPFGGPCQPGRDGHCEQCGGVL
jgi:hypothetical protein